MNIFHETTLYIFHTTLHIHYGDDIARFEGNT
jgi:hypothetical protein